MLLTYKIGAVTVALEAAHSMHSSGLFSRFEVPNCKAPVLRYHIQYTDTLPDDTGAVPYGICSLLPLADSTLRFYTGPERTRPFACARELGDEMQIEILSAEYPWGTEPEQLFPLLSLPHMLLKKSHLILHGAFLQYGADGLLFCGHSGIGKTTQSRLWQKRFGAIPINEDRAVLDASGTTVRVCGVPVAGSSPYCENQALPLKAIIMLAQGAENRLELLPVSKSVPRLADGIYLTPSFESDRTAYLELALQICTQVPIFRLTCRPDVQSAELVHRTVFEGVPLCKTPI